MNDLNDAGKTSSLTPLTDKYFVQKTSSLMDFNLPEERNNAEDFMKKITVYHHIRATVFERNIWYQLPAKCVQTSGSSISTQLFLSLVKKDVLVSANEP